MAADVRVRLSAEGVAEVVGALRKIQSEGQKTGKAQASGFQSFNRILGDTRRLLGAVGIGITALGAIRGIQSSIDILRQWETAFAEVKTIANGTDEELAQVERRVLGLSTIVPQEGTLLAKGYYQVLSSGITDPGDALYFLERAAKAGVGGVSDTSTSVKLGAAVFNAYKLQIKDVDRLYDQLFTTVREGTVEFPQLANAVGPAIPVFAQAGFKIEELLAGIATLTKGGFAPERAATALRDAVVKLIKPTDDTKKLAKELGIEFTAEAAAAKGLVPFLKEVSDKTEGNQEAIARLFPDVQGMTAVMSLAGNQWEEFGRILNVVEHEPLGAAEQAFQKMTAAEAAQDQLIRNRLKVAWIELDDSIGNVSKRLTSNIASILPASFEENAQALQRLSAQIDLVDRHGADLIEQYRKMKRQNDGSVEGNQNVAKAMRDLAAEFPQVITDMNELGEVTGINVDLLKKFREQLVLARAVKGKETFGDQAARAGELRDRLAELDKQFDRLKGRRGGEPLFPPETYAGAGTLSRPGRGGSTPLVREERLRIREEVLKARAELNDVESKLAQTLIDARLAPQVIAIDDLAKAVDANEAPANALDKALQGVSLDLQAILDTADPKELEKRLREMAAVLRKADPELRFLAGGEGPARPPKPTKKSNQQSQEEKDAEARRQKALAQLERTILEAQGKQLEADLLKIEEQVQAAAEAGVSGDKLTQLRETLTSRARFEDIQRRARAALDDLSEARRGVNEQVQRGLLTQEQGEKQILEIERARLQALKDLAAALLAAAQATGDPALIAQAKQFADSVAYLGTGIHVAAQAAETLSDRFNGALLDSMTEFFDAAGTRARTLKELLGALLDPLFASLHRLASEFFAAKLFTALGFELPKKAQGGLVGLSSGGLAEGPGTGTSDSLLVRLSKGEFVTRAAVVAQPGVLGFLEALNRKGPNAINEFMAAQFATTTIGLADLALATGGYVSQTAQAAEGPPAGGPRPGRLLVEHDPGFILRVLESPEGQEIHLKNTGKNRKGMNQALGRNR